MASKTLKNVYISKTIFAYQESYSAIILREAVADQPLVLPETLSIFFLTRKLLIGITNWEQIKHAPLFQRTESQNSTQLAPYAF